MFCEAKYNNCPSKGNKRDRSQPTYPTKHKQQQHKDREKKSATGSKNEQKTNQKQNTNT
jgi:hypothetical protein